MLSMYLFARYVVDEFLHSMLLSSISISERGEDGTPERRISRRTWKASHCAITSRTTPPTNSLT